MNPPLSLLRQPATWLVIVALLTTAIYWIGLHGAFMLDDAPNFAGIKAWLSGSNSLQNVLFGNDSWLTHRTLAMASFAANAALFGYDPFGFKLANLVLHVICGICIYLVVIRLMQRDQAMAPHASLAALLLASVWLLHPLHVSTVLYAVQQMTQWAALCCLLGLWLYLAVRDRLERGEIRPAWPALFIALPALVLLGIQGKQNAVVLPALCLVLELAYYRTGKPMPRTIKLFFLAFLALPVLLASIVLLLKPELVLAGYAEYDFTPWQRLLSQARVLWDYLQQLLLPHTPSMGVNTDDFVASTQLFAPASTALAILGLFAISLAAWVFRRRLPGFFAGWFFFLVAHGVESTFLPLELYYEHRNYLPSVGLFLAAASLVAALGRQLTARGVRVGRIGLACAGGLVLALALQTHGRARVWSDPLILMESELRNHPKSVRAVINYIGIASDLGDVPRAYAVADQTIANASNRRLKGQVMMFRAWLDCIHRNGTSVAELQTAIETLPPHLDINTINYLDPLEAAVYRGQCGALGQPQLAQGLATIADRATAQPDNLNLKWGLRNRSAFLFARSGHWEEALVQARLGWQPSTPGEGAGELVEIFLVNGQVEEAQRVLAQALAKEKENHGALRDLEVARQLVAAELESPGWNRRRVMDAGKQPER